MQINYKYIIIIILAMSSQPLKVILIALICVLGSSQFMNPGCASFDNAGICLYCQPGYYMSSGICMPLNPLCLTFNSTNGNCLSCFSGFMISGTNCVSIPKIANCITYSSTGACTSCDTGYYPSNNICAQVNPLCKSYNSTNRDCLTCLNGYYLNGTTCSPTPIANCKTQTSIVCNACNTGYYLINSTCLLGDIRCINYNLSTCTACSAGFAPAESICVTAIENCLTYFTDGSCMSCTAGYEYTGLICEKVFVPDLNCHIYDNNTQCIECSRGYYFDANKTCIQADPNCQTFDNQTGACTSCYSGYSLNLTACIVNRFSSNPFCSKSNGSVCVTCSKGYHFNDNKTCVESNPFCSSFDNTTFSCLECYKGYKIDLNGTCILNSDTHCQTWKIGGCVNCDTGFYPLNGTCQQTDPLCSKMNATTYKCLECYQGYSISSTTGLCQLNTINEFCFKFDLKNINKCIQCYNGYYLKDGLCVLLDLSKYNCRTYEMATGKCTSCHKGRKLKFLTKECKAI